MNKLQAAIQSGDTAKAIDLIKGKSLRSRLYRFLYSTYSYKQCSEYYIDRNLSYQTWTGNLLQDHSDDARSYPPLHMAARSGLTAVVLALIEAGVPVDSLNGEGYTSLHLAVFFGKCDTVKALVANGADLKKYIQDVPRGVGGRDSRWVCLPIGANFYYKPIDVAVVTCDVDTVTYMLRHGSVANGGVVRRNPGSRVDDDSSDIKDEHICSTLLTAMRNSQNDDVKMIRLLLQFGANPNTYRYNSDTFYDDGKSIAPELFFYSALSYALSHNKKLVAAELLCHGAKIYQTVFIDPAMHDFDRDIYSLSGEDRKPYLSILAGETCCLTQEQVSEALNIATKCGIAIPDNVDVLRSVRFAAPITRLIPANTLRSCNGGTLLLGYNSDLKNKQHHYTSSSTANKNDDPFSVALGTAPSGGTGVSSSAYAPADKLIATALFVNTGVPYPAMFS